MDILESEFNLQKKHIIKPININPIEKTIINTIDAFEYIY